MSAAQKAFDLLGKLDPDLGLILEDELGADWEASLEKEVAVIAAGQPSDDPIANLLACAPFLDSTQTRRLFRGDESAKVAAALGLEPGKNELANCRNIEAYFKSGGR